MVDVCQLMCTCRSTATVTRRARGTWAYSTSTQALPHAGYVCAGVSDTWLQPAAELAGWRLCCCSLGVHHVVPWVQAAATNVWEPPVHHGSSHACNS
jgi:hypothetical protein